MPTSATTTKQRLLDDLGVDVRHLEMRDPPEKPLGGGLVAELLGRAIRLAPNALGPDARRRPRRAGRRDDVRRAEILRLADARPVRLFGLWPTSAAAWTHYALLYGFADVWQRPALVRGWEKMFFDMIDRPEWAHFLCRKFADFYCEDYTRAAEATGGRIDLYLLISDLGGQTGPLISLATFREFVAPYLKQMIDCIHGLGGEGALP